MESNSNFLNSKAQLLEQLVLPLLPRPESTFVFVYFLLILHYILLDLPHCAPNYVIVKLDTLLEAP